MYIYTFIVYILYKVFILELLAVCLCVLCMQRSFSFVVGYVIIYAMVLVHVVVFC